MGKRSHSHKKKQAGGAASGAAADLEETIEVTDTIEVTETIQVKESIGAKGASGAKESIGVTAAGLKIQTDDAPVVAVELQTAALAKEHVVHTTEEYVQPVITRDVTKTEIHQIEQPVLESETRPVIKEVVTLDQKNVELDQYGNVAPITVPKAQHVEDIAEVHRIVREPIIREVVHHRIIEQIQPIIYREITQPHERTILQPIHERIVEAPVVTKTVAAPILAVDSLSQTVASLKIGGATVLEPKIVETVVITPTSITDTVQITETVQVEKTVSKFKLADSLGDVPELVSASSRQAF